jgi:hypothetical protein
MKRISLVITITILLFVCINRINAQTLQTKLNQVELYKQFLGKWQLTVSKDTIEISEGQLYGEAVIITVSQVIKGKKFDYYKCFMGYDPKDGKIKGFIVMPNADFITWVGMFTNEKEFSGETFYSFDLENPWEKWEYDFVNPKECIVTINTIGVKTKEYKYYKVN